MKRVAVIGAHGLYANYGGWDQLLKNLAEKKSSETIEYLIFNSKESAKVVSTPKGVKVRHINLSASGFEGIFYDFYTILISFFKVDAFLLLGVQGIPLLAVLSIFRKKHIVSNVGGLEWERPKFGYLAKTYLKLCFNLSFKLSNYVVLDNEHYLSFSPPNNESKIKIIPYGGDIDNSLQITESLIEKYPFLTGDYFLSISRALEDNCIEELCLTFKGRSEKLVLICNFMSSDYGLRVYEKFKEERNIILIKGLYIKPELDLIRRNCIAYIHTHTLCGTAPSLVEMIISERPILSIDVPQNRFTLDNNGAFFKNFEALESFLDSNSYLDDYRPMSELKKRYKWDLVISKYEQMFE